MNGFVPVLVAVLLAEIGPRALLYGDVRRHRGLHAAMGVLLVLAGAASTAIAPALTEWADALMIAIALAFAAVGQVQRVRPVTGFVPTIAAFWSGGALLLVFAMATRFGPVAAIAGGGAGLAAAAILTRTLAAGAIPMPPVRWAAAAVLTLASAFVAIGALRLV